MNEQSEPQRSIDNPEAYPGDEGFYGAIIENSSDLIFTVDGSRTVKFISPSVRRVLGYETSEMAGVDSFAFIHPDDLPAMVKLFNIIIQDKGKSYATHCRVRHRDGSWRHLETQNRAVDDKEGTLIIIVNARDVSVRKWAEEELRKSEERYRHLFDAIPVAIGISSPEGRLLMANAEHVRMSGYTLDELQSLNVRNRYVQPGEREKILHILHETGQVRDYEVEFRRKDGSLYCVLLNMDRIELDGQEHYLVTQRDITERKQTEMELGRYRGRLEELVESRTAALLQEVWERRSAEEKIAYQHSLLNAQMEASLDGILVVDDQGDPISYNGRFIELWGIPREIMEQRSSKAGLEFIRDQVLNADAFIERVEYLYEHKDAISRDELALTRGRYFERYSSSIRDGQGEYIGRVWYFRDITEKKRNEHELKSYAGQMQALSSRLAEVREEERRSLARELHDEIGQLLTGMKLSLDMMADSITGKPAAELLKVRELAAELLARVRSLSLDLRPSMLDDFGLVPALEWHFKRYTGQTGIEVDFESRIQGERLPPAIETVVFRMIQEGLTNIARHANVREASVQISEERSVLVVTVDDKGKGFDPQQALSEAQTLGLIGMQERVAAINGHLDVQSGPGEGTLLTAVIPVPTSS